MNETVLEGQDINEAVLMETVDVPSARRWKNPLNTHKLEPIYRRMVTFLVQHGYAPEYYGFDQIPDEGPALLISNHISYLDGLIIAAACDRPVRFVIDKYIYEQPIVNYFMRLNRAIPIAPKKHIVEEAMDEISEGLRNGDVICIFPEGQITYTGNLSRFKPGVEWIVQRDPVPVIPIALKGLWGSVFSRKYLKAKGRLWRGDWHSRGKIKAICGAPIPPEKVTVNYLQRVIMTLKNSI